MSVSRLVWCLVVLPALFAALLVHRYAVDVPFWDEWAMVGFLDLADKRSLTFATLLSQHNEHRPATSRVITIATASLWGWNTRSIMWLSQALLLATLFGCWALWRRTLVNRSTWAVLSLALASLVLYSPAQYQNFFWGFQISFYVPVACMLAAVLVASPRHTTLGLALAVTAALSTVATFSVLFGFLNWGFGALALLAAYGVPRGRDLWKWGLWVAALVCVVALYLAGYEHPASHPSLLSTLRQPFAVFTGFAACIGSGLSLGPGRMRIAMAMVVGAAVIFTFVYLLFEVWCRRTDEELVSSAMPWAVLGGFGLVAGAGVSLSRIGYGYGAVVESRYATLVGWVFIAFIMLAAVLRDRSESLNADSRAALWRWSSIGRQHPRQL